MSRAPKILFGLSLLLLALSYPACHFGEIKAKSEMAKYSAEFVAAHEFDLIFGRWVLPGIWLFFSGLLSGFIAILIWFVGRRRAKMS